MAVGDKPFGLREVRALVPGGELRDGRPGSVSGFGARRQKGDAVAYFVTYRNNGRLRRFTIGRHGAPWTPETARKEALRILGLVAAGGDPAAERREERHAETVAELCDLYMEAATSGRLLTRRRRPKKPSTIAMDRSRIEAHVKPLLGHLKARAVTRRDIERFMHQVAEGRSARRAKLAKPRALDALESGMWPPALACVRFLALTGVALRRGADAAVGHSGPRPAHRPRLATLPCLRRPEVVHGGCTGAKRCIPSRLVPPVCPRHREVVPTLGFEPRTY